MSTRIAFVGHDGCNNLVNGSFVSHGQSPVAPGNWWIFSCDFERWYVAKGDFTIIRVSSSIRLYIEYSNSHYLNCTVGSTYLVVTIKVTIIHNLLHHILVTIWLICLPILFLPIYALIVIFI